MSTRAQRNLRSAAALVMVVLSIAAVSQLFVNVIPPHAETLSGMEETAIRIQLFFRQNRRLPANLVSLPIRAGYLNRTTDGWNAPLIYSVESLDTFTLRSSDHNAVAGTRHRYRVQDGTAVQVP